MLTQWKAMAFFLGSIILATSCESPTVEIDGNAERQAILALHHAQRDYHFDKMVEEFVSLMSDSFISVNKGEISRPTKEANRTRFSNYFNAVEFEKWDDKDPPIIRFADDYSLAYTVVNKEVALRYQHDAEPPERETTHFSWVAIYKKYHDGWKIDCVASTNLPSTTEIIEGN